MKSKLFYRLAIILIIEVGLVHFFSSQHEFEEAWILGYLFIGNFLGALVAAYGIYRQKAWGWLFGFGITAGSMAAFIWSRTSGLPGLRPEEWFSPWGVVSLITESAFCLLFLLWVVRRRPLQANPGTETPRWRYLLPLSGLLGLVLINASVLQWDASYPDLAHEHVFFLWQVLLQPQITSSTLEDQYGLEVSRAAISFLNGVVDVRMKVLDSEKADPLIEEGHFALLVGDTLIPAPHIHRHMLKNRTIILFFPNSNNMISRGTPVSIVFENLRVEPIEVQ